LKNDPSPIYSAARSDINQAFCAFRSGDTSASLGRKFLALASEGHLEANFYLGCMYEDGSNGFVADLDKAYECYSVAEAAGSVEAALAVAKFHLLGLVSVANAEFAKEKYMRLADMENFSAVACYRLGRLFHSGSQVRRDLQLASHYYEKAASKDNLSATIYLARIEFRRGRFVRWISAYLRSIKLGWRLRGAGRNSQEFRQW
jgi:TPR repeat protein